MNGARDSTCTCRDPSVSRTSAPRGRCHLPLLEPYLLERRRPRIGIDEHQCGLLHARPDAARPVELEDGRETHALVEHLLDLEQQGLALLAIRLHGLLLVERVDVRIAAVRVGAVARHDLRHPRGGVAVEAAAADAHTLELLRAPRREKGGALHRPHPQLDPEGTEIVHDRFAARSVSISLIARRSSARLAARRTRRSAQGDFGSHMSRKSSAAIPMPPENASLSAGSRWSSSACGASSM